MYGSYCYNKKCSFCIGKPKTYGRCKNPKRKMFMLCEITYQQYQEKNDEGV